jgi:hypothetical protein
MEFNISFTPSNSLLRNLGLTLQQVSSPEAVEE